MSPGTGGLESTLRDPENLLGWMSAKLTYGWWDGKRGEVREDFGAEFAQRYRLMTPEEVFSRRCGVCQDQAIFEAAIFRKMTDWPECRLVFVQQFYGSTHTFLVYDGPDGLYHFENSFWRMRGIHGPFRSVEDIAERVYGKMDAMRRRARGYRWQLVPEERFAGRTDVGIYEYLAVCGYDFRRSA